jgi:hypothetical protein
MISIFVLLILIEEYLACVRRINSMAEKEERILIDRSTDYTLTDTDKGELFDGKIAPHCANVMTRQEAIERIARAICRSGENECIGDCASCDLWKVGPEKDYAEAALNALLGDK